MTNDEATHSVIDWSKHIGLFVGGLTTLIIALRIFGTAHWDLDTAFGILSENGTANVLTGSLLSSLPLVFVAALVIAEPWIWWRYNIGTQAERTGLIFLTIALILVAVLIAPFYLLVLALAIRLFVALFRFVRHRNRRRKKQPKSGYTKLPRVSRFELITIVSNLFIAVLFISITRPWLPSEVIELNGSYETVYTLNTTGEYATVLLHSPRKIVQVEQELLVGEYCRHSDYSLLTVNTSLILDEERYPECPELD